MQACRDACSPAAVINCKKPLLAMMASRPLPRRQCTFTPQHRRSENIMEFLIRHRRAALKFLGAPAFRHYISVILLQKFSSVLLPTIISHLMGISLMLHVDFFLSSKHLHFSPIDAAKYLLMITRRRDDDDAGGEAFPYAKGVKLPATAGCAACKPMRRHASKLYSSAERYPPGHFDMDNILIYDTPSTAQPEAAAGRPAASGRSMHMQGLYFI